MYREVMTPCDGGVLAVAEAPECPSGKERKAGDDRPDLRP